jgi:PAS domain S-box-containing protein
MTNEISDVVSNFPSNFKEMNSLGWEIYKKALDNAYDHIVITDPDGVIIFANKGVTRTTGYETSEVIGKTPRLWGGLMPKEFYDEFWRIVKIEKKPFHGEITNQKKNKEKYIAEISVTSILNENQEVQFLIGIERDITRIKQIDQAKSDFISLSSHELRAPLSTINWYLENMLSVDHSNMTEEQIDCINTINEASKEMTDLVNRLLDLSRIETSKFQMSPTYFNLTEKIEEIIENFKVKFKDKNITVKKNFDLDENVFLDKRLIIVAVQNVISNAYKYVNDNGQIDIKLFKHGNDLVISVKDNGIGIPDDQQNKIFERFFRAQNALLSKSSGTGLGLYLSKSIIEAHKGTIKFHSQEGIGTEFIIQIPIQVVFTAK